MKNYPIISLFPRIWMLLIFMVAANYACFSNYQITKPIWHHSQEKAWVQVTDGTWQKTLDGGWVLEPGHTLFDYFGAMIYIPAVASTVMVLAVLIVHLFYRQTIDKDTHDGTYMADWRALTSEERVRYATIVRIALLIGMAIIAAGIGK